MEYFLGSVITILGLWIFSKLPNSQEVHKTSPITYSQSHVFELIKPFIPISALDNFKIKPTQAIKHLESITKRVLFMGNSAYWINENTLFTAQIVDGEVSEETTMAVDTMGMDKVQLNKTIFIVEQLREGLLDDSWDSGESKL